jgi:GxxExxY protein
MKVSQKYLDELTYNIIGCAIEVHKFLGPGLLESVYEKCFIRELILKGMSYERQKSVPLNYKGLLLNAELRYDVLVEDLIIVELKAVECILPVHEAVLLSYMRMLEKPKGILFNFKCSNIFREGQKTLVNHYFGSLPKS